MSGAVLTMNATIMCAHGGAVQPVAGSNHFFIDGVPALTPTTTAVVSGCPFHTEDGAPMPCVSVHFQADADLLVFGEPILTQSSVGIAVPSGAPVLVTNPGQQRVWA